MANGAVVAAGTPAGIIAGAVVTVVQAPAWQAAFQRLTGLGLEVTLAGQSLRVPSAGPAPVRDALGLPPGDPDALGVASADGIRVTVAPATLEERFFQLVQAG